MWVVYAFSAAFFAGVTSILAKIGIKHTDSNLATALRTVVVAVFAWLVVFAAGSQSSITGISAKSLVFLVLSGLATGGSWLCYFRALKLGDVSKVVPVDKSSTVLTIVLSVIFLSESLTWVKAAAVILIGAGTYLMIERKSNKPEKFNGFSGSWLFYAILSAVFASLTAILAKIGIADVEANLGTAIRTMVVLVMAWVIVFISGKHRDIKDIDKRSRVFIALSGIATGLSWLCFYRALQDGPVSVVVPIDKLSILITIMFSFFILREKLSKWSVAGLAMITVGTLSMLVV